MGKIARTDDGRYVFDTQFGKLYITVLAGEYHSNTYMRKSCVTTVFVPELLITSGSSNGTLTPGEESLIYRKRPVYVRMRFEYLSDTQQWRSTTHGLYQGGIAKESGLQYGRETETYKLISREVDVVLHRFHRQVPDWVADSECRCLVGLANAARSRLNDALRAAKEEEENMLDLIDSLHAVKGGAEVARAWSDKNCARDGVTLSETAKNKGVIYG